MKAAKFNITQLLLQSSARFKRIFGSSFLFVMLIALNACQNTTSPTTTIDSPSSTPAIEIANGEPSAESIPTIEEAMNTCKSDADCEVKNIGNCCGYMPACVNQSAQPNPDAVQAKCAAEGMVSTCGFREISSCACVNNICEAAGGGEMVQ